MSDDVILLYHGADVNEWLNSVEPSIIDLDDIVLGLKRASGGVPRAHVWAVSFAECWYMHLGQDPAQAASYVAELWDSSRQGEDLRVLAMRQVSRHRDMSLDCSLSNNHPDVIAEMTRELDRMADELEVWARRPRECLGKKLEAEEASAAWPRPLKYSEKHHGAKDARFFVGERPWKTLSSNEALYSLRDGSWSETTDAQLAWEVRATDPHDRLDVQHVNKLVEGVHQLTTVTARPFEWITPQAGDPAPEDLALFKNGLLDVKEGWLFPHDGRYFATGLPDHAWDPLAECPGWLAWLDETLDPAFHPTLQEWFGYCLTPDVRAHRFAVFLGGPRSGKSTAHNVLHALVGAQHSASMMMPDLGGDFGLESLLDKRLAIVPDAHDAPSRNRAAALERIKSVTGADPVSVNRKNRSIVSGVLKTRLLVTCNRLPKFIDESGALAARMLLVRFERSFLGREDRNMGERLRAEMPGIANWALEGLKRLRAAGLRFTVSEAGRMEAELAARSQSPSLRFAEDRLEVTLDPEHFTPLTTVHKSYRQWAHDEGLGNGEWRSQNELAGDLQAALRGVKHTQRRIGGRATYGLSGVKSAKLDSITDFTEMIT